MKQKLITFLIITTLFIQCSATTKKRSFGEVVDDNVILIKLRSKLMKNKSVDSNNIKVKIWKGVVSLNGTLDSQEQINKAIEITEQQRGVKEVRAYLVLKTDPPLTPQEDKSKQNSWSFLEQTKKDKKAPKVRKVKTGPKNNPDLEETDITENGKKKDNDTEVKEDEFSEDFKEFEY